MVGSGMHPGMGWYDGGWWMGLHGVVWLLFVVGVIVGIVFLVRAVGGASGRADRGRALDVLEQRYARGEIGREEYLEKKQDLM